MSNGRDIPIVRALQRTGFSLLCYSAALLVAVLGGAPHWLGYVATVMSGAAGVNFAVAFGFMVRHAEERRQQDFLDRVVRDLKRHREELAAIDRAAHAYDARGNGVVCHFHALDGAEVREDGLVLKSGTVEMCARQDCEQYSDGSWHKPRERRFHYHETPGKTRRAGFGSLRVQDVLVEECENTYCVQFSGKWYRAGELPAADALRRAGHGDGCPCFGCTEERMTQ